MVIIFVFITVFVVRLSSFILYFETSLLQCPATFALPVFVLINRLPQPDEYHLMSPYVSWVQSPGLTLFLCLRPICPGVFVS